jgi:hypothetical protein
LFAVKSTHQAGYTFSYWHSSLNVVVVANPLVIIFTFQTGRFAFELYINGSGVYEVSSQ